MSKGYSGLFAGTTGYQSFFDIVAYPSPPETTAVVWDHLKATQENYDGTILPKSFIIDVPPSSDAPKGKLWTHGNSTEHMYEAISSIKENLQIKNSNPFLYTQFILYDYYKSVGNVVSNGIKYGKKITYGSWEFVFSKPRNNRPYPVVKHAKFIGLQRKVNIYEL